MKNFFMNHNINMTIRQWTYLLIALASISFATVSFGETVRFFRYQMDGMLLYPISEHELSLQDIYYEAHYDDANELIFYSIKVSDQIVKNPYDVDDRKPSNQAMFASQIDDIEAALNNHINYLKEKHNSHITDSWNEISTKNNLDQSVQNYQRSKERLQFEWYKSNEKEAEQDYKESLEYLRYTTNEYNRISRNELSRENTTPSTDNISALTPESYVRYTDIQAVDNDEYQRVKKEYQEAKTQVDQAREQYIKTKQYGLTPWSPEKHKQFVILRTHTFVWEANHQKRIESWKDGKGTALGKEEITYSDDYKILQRKQFTRMGKLTHYINYTYDRDLLKKEELYNTDGSYRITEFRYQQNQLSEKHIQFNTTTPSVLNKPQISTENPTGSTIGVERYLDSTYYRDGYIYKTDRYTQDNRLLYSRYFNANGLLTKEERYTPQGTKAEYVQISYDGSGNRICEEFYFSPEDFTQPHVIMIGKEKIELNPANFNHPNYPLLYAKNEYLPNEMISTFYFTNHQDTDQSKIKAYSQRQYMEGNELVQLKHLETFNKEGRIIKVDYIQGNIPLSQF